MRIAKIHDSEEIMEENVSSPVINEATLRQYAGDPLLKMTANNVASIAFIWEYKNHKVLFMGDADPSQVATAIEKIYPDEEKPIVFDLIKVSHHGSAHSMSQDLINAADSELYFFTGGSKKAPSIQTLGRIITPKLPNGISCREIRYNRPNDLLRELIGLSDEAKSKLNFHIKENDNCYEVFC